MTLADITVQSVEGEAVRLGDVVDRPTVLVIPRYYGCLRRLSERLDDVHAAGAAALGVSVGADYQARWLMAEQGVRFPLLVDPGRRVYAAPHHRDDARRTPSRLTRSESLAVHERSEE